MAQECLCGGSGVARECVLERGEVRVLKFCEELVAASSVDVITIVVLLTLFSVIGEERLLVKGGCPL